MENPVWKWRQVEIWQILHVNGYFCHMFCNCKCDQAWNKAFYGRWWKRRKEVQQAVSFSNTQHISESACFDLSPCLRIWVLFDLKHLGGKCCWLSKLNFIVRAEAFQHVLVIQSNFLIGLDMQIPNKHFHLKNTATDSALFHSCLRG